jgi:hypothetical protein
MQRNEGNNLQLQPWLGVGCRWDMMWEPKAQPQVSPANLMTTDW